jgi:hypothetical protein
VWHWLILGWLILDWLILDWLRVGYGLRVGLIVLAHLAERSTIAVGGLPGVLVTIADVHGLRVRLRRHTDPVAVVHAVAPWRVIRVVE